MAEPTAVHEVARVPLADVAVDPAL
ncbi:MAG: hypothetical protein JWR66_2952, partial [Modestobacter sp.]|nr:hypothetical protein [Modestobacter sp.]